MVNKITVNNQDSNYTHSIFDISEYTGNSYSTLSDALNDIPQAKRKGGMTIRYVPTNDNKYVQFRYMGTETTGSSTPFLDTANWKGEISVNKNTLSIGKDIEFVNVSFEKTLAGKGDSINVINLNFIAGNTYRIRPIKKNWTYSNSLTYIVALRLQKIVNGVITQIINESNVNNVQTEYTFTADADADYYQLYIRADVGKYAQFEIENITELLQIKSGSHYYGYVECTSAADSVYKDVTIPQFPINGDLGRFVVRFTNGNTANEAVLRINNGLSYNIYFNGYKISSTNTWDGAIRADVIIFSNTGCILNKVFYIQDKIDGSTIAVPTSKAVKEYVDKYNIWNIGYKYNNIPLKNGYIDNKGYVNGDFGTLTLDSVIYEDKTIREIFETNNFLGISGGFENGSFSPMTANAGTPTIESSVVDSGTYALEISGQTPTQIKSATQHGTAQKCYYAMCIKVASYTNGIVGFRTTNVNLVLSDATNDFVTLSKVTDCPIGSEFIGSGKLNDVAPDLTAYIDTPVVIELESLFNTVPSKAEMDEFYRIYVEIKKNGSIDLGHIRVPVTGAVKTYSDEECKAAFVEYMNNKASIIGMVNSHFSDGSGYEYENSAITPSDALKLIMRAQGCDEIVKAWTKPSHLLDIHGENARTETVVPADRSDFTNYYTLFGTKTGTRAGVNNIVFTCNAPDNNWFIASIINSTPEERWKDAKKLIDIANLLYNNPSADISSITLTATGAAVAIMPCHNPLAYDTVNIQTLYTKQPTTAQYPASVTKTMTAICALDWITDMNEFVTIKQSDITGGSGPQLAEGDMLSFRECMYAMFIPSSNTVAVALSRVIGQKILTYQNNN